MHIFIDESGTFVRNAERSHSISAVGALVIPTGSMEGFEKLYGRVRRQLPMDRGEVKGRQLAEDQVKAVAKVLRKVGCIFEVVTIDMGLHSEDDLRAHKDAQANAITANLTSSHHPNMVAEIRELRSQLEGLPLQLYVQSVAMGELIYNTLYHANIFFAFRAARELGEYHWIVDAKGTLKTTPWEEWWSKVILPSTQSHSLREPLAEVEGGDYRWAERFYVKPSEHFLSHAQNPQQGGFSDLRKVLMEDFRFSPDPEFGLEAVDILTNTVRRSMAGNFKRPGWMSLPPLMIHRSDNYYVRMIHLCKEEPSTGTFPYMNVLKDFRTGGRQMFPDESK